MGKHAKFLGGHQSYKVVNPPCIYYKITIKCQLDYCGNLTM